MTCPQCEHANAQGSTACSTCGGVLESEHVPAAAETRASDLFGRRHRLIFSLVALLPIAAITAYALLFAGDIRDLQNIGYAGVLAANLLASGTFVLPLPGLAVAFGAAAVLNPVLVALAGATGSTVGEMAGYAVGASAHSTFGDRMERNRWYRRVEGWLRRYGALTIVALAATPTPLFDVAGFAAGSLAYPAPRFAAACWLGKTVKFLLVSLAGAWSIPTVAAIFGL